MLQIFLSLFRNGRAAADDNSGNCPQQFWRRDLLAHPDLAGMSERQLADLPMPHLPSLQS
jgi:hypothetical protein